MTVDLALFPLDTLKTRLQSQSGFLASGGFRGIYAGVGSALVGSAPGAALFFVSYEGVKRFFKEAREQNSSWAVGGAPTHTLLTAAWAAPLEHMIAASVGEVAACMVRVPTEVVKQRAQALQASSSAAALGAILRQRSKIGVLGVWKELNRGWTVTVIREVPFTIIQFPLWEGLKEWRRRTAVKDTIEGWESGLAGSVSGGVAAAITTPLDVLKTRMMLAREKVGAVTMARQIVRESGPRAFFSGMGPRTLWIGIGGWIFLGSYQWAYNALGT